MKRNSALAPWCNENECEESSKKRSGQDIKEQVKESDDSLTGSAKIFNIPYDMGEVKPGSKCFSCGKDAKVFALWGRSY